MEPAHREGARIRVCRLHCKAVGPRDWGEPADVAAPSGMCTALYQHYITQLTGTCANHGVVQASAAFVDLGQFRPDHTNTRLQNTEVAGVRFHRCNTRGIHTSPPPPLCSKILRYHTTPLFVSVQHGAPRERCCDPPAHPFLCFWVSALLCRLSCIKRWVQRTAVPVSSQLFNGRWAAGCRAVVNRPRSLTVRASH